MAGFEAPPAGADVASLSLKVRMDFKTVSTYSAVVKMFAPVEDIILDGPVQDGYACDSASVNLLASKVGEESVLLVSDYSPNPGQVTVSVAARSSYKSPTCSLNKSSSIWT